MRSAVVRPLTLVPLALAAITMPAAASGHHAAMPARRAPAVQPARSARAATPREGRSSGHAGAAKSSATGRKQVSATVNSRGSRGMAYAAALRGREAEAGTHGHADSRRTHHNGRVQPVPHELVSRAMRPALPHKTAVAQHEDEQPETAADRRTSARIHAWYSHQSTMAPQAKTQTVPPGPNAPTMVASVTPLPTGPSTLLRKPALEPARPVELQHPPASATDDAHSTAADDKADAESHIPSTAPTERVPSPFVHGDSLDTLPADHSRTTGAPAVRQGTGAPVQLGRGITPQAQPALRAGSGPTVLSVVPQTTALTKVAPAVASVQSNARHPKLDQVVAAGMAEENFDDDGTPATARTAVTLATGRGTGKPLTAQENAEPLPSLAAVNVNLYDGNGHLLVMAPMKGSHDILVHQNQMALEDGLERVQDDAQLSQMRRQKLLVALPDDDTIYPNDVLPLNRRYARSWTVRFLRDLGRAHYARFGTPLIVTSAVRTVAFQRHLVRVNANAAPPTGDVASPHLYGQAIDIGKRGMGLMELTWMRAYLTPVESDGKIDVEEEFQQACFHISVYRKYTGLPAKPAQQLRVPTLLQARTAAPPAVKAEPKQERGRRRLPTALLATGLR